MNKQQQLANERSLIIPGHKIYSVLETDMQKTIGRSVLVACRSRKCSRYFGFLP
jgi:hypothetical protein